MDFIRAPRTENEFFMMYARVAMAWMTGVLLLRAGLERHVQRRFKSFLKEVVGSNSGWTATERDLELFASNPDIGVIREFLDPGKDNCPAELKEEKLLLYRFDRRAEAFIRLLSIPIIFGIEGFLVLSLICLLLIWLYNYLKYHLPW